MEKYLLTIEFRYLDKPDSLDISNKTKKITLGVYNDYLKACEKGNKLLEFLETKYKIHTYPDGNKAKKERFSENGGCFGMKKNLVSNIAYLKTPFQFFVKITTLKYEPIEQAVQEVEQAFQNYKDFQTQ